MIRRRAVWSTLAVLALISGCAQTRKVANGRDDARAAGESERGRATSSAAPNRATGQPPREGKPPLPGTPSGLVTDSAARQIREQLQRRGYLEHPTSGGELDAPTSDALRRFQQHEGLASTGFPDRETLRRLNVDAEHAYRAAPEETRDGKGN